MGSASKYDATLQIIYIQPGNSDTYKELKALKENHQKILEFYEDRFEGNVEQATEGGPLVIAPTNTIGN